MTFSFDAPFWITSIWVSLFIKGFVGESSNIYSVARQYNTNVSVPVSSSNSTVGENKSDITNNHDYIVKLHFILNEDAVVPYLRDLTYTHHDMFNITTEDLIQLSNFREMDLNQSITVLQKLNISENIMNVDNLQQILEISNLTFNDFFEKLKNTTTLFGEPFRNALQILSIDLGNFSAAIAYGDKNDVYITLKQGVYTREKLEEAAKAVGTDLTTFYKHMKTIVLDNMKLNTISYYGEKLKQNPMFDKNLYDNIWMALNLNISDVYRVVNFRSIVDNIYNRMNENITLGIVTSEHEITFPRKIYNRLEQSKNLMNVYAESVLYPGRIYDNITIKKSVSEKSAELWSNNSIPTSIEIEHVMPEKNPVNCSVITVFNTELIEHYVEILNKSECCLVVKANYSTELNSGSPLICDGKLHGLSSMCDTNRNLYAFDTFYTKTEHIPVSGSDDRIHLLTTFLNLISFSLLLFVF